MKGAPPPLRFLLLAVGGWIGLRAAVLAPQWWTPSTETAPIAAAAAPPVSPTGRTIPEPAAPHASLGPYEPPAGRRAVIVRAVLNAQAPAASIPPGPLAATAPETARMWVHPSFPPLQPWAPLRPPRGGDGRWSVSSWLLVRREGGAAPLATGGELGGSQTGVRLAYRLNRDSARPLALSARVSAPLRRPRGAEAAVGLDWRPVRGLPIHAVVERRQALGREGRSAFAIGLHGGGSMPLAQGFRLDGYGQAGVVGLDAGDPYVDGAARISRSFGPLEVGAGAWGAAQPGAARLDLGPHVTLPVGGLRVSAEWRFRIAGDAAPRSGPALVVGMDF